MGRKGDQLTAKERAFCREYIQLGNAEQAAIAAGYSKTTARAKAAGWLAKVGIRNEIARLEGKLERKALMGAQETEELLDRLCRANPADYYDEQGKLKPINKLTREQAYAVKFLGKDAIELHGPHGALKLKMQRLGMLKTTLEVGNTFEDWIKALRQGKK